MEENFPVILCFQIYRMKCLPKRKVLVRSQNQIVLWHVLVLQVRWVAQDINSSPAAQTTPYHILSFVIIRYVFFFSFFSLLLKSVLSTSLSFSLAPMSVRQNISLPSTNRSFLSSVFPILFATSFLKNLQGLKKHHVTFALTISLLWVS